MGEPTQGQVCYHGSYDHRVQFDPETSPDMPYVLWWRGKPDGQFASFGKIEFYTGIKRRQWSEWK